MKTCFIFGDSLMRGVMPDESGMYHSSGALRLDEIGDQAGVLVVNYAMPTFTSERVLMYAKTIMMTAAKPDEVIIECGGNDCDYNWKELVDGSGDLWEKHRATPQDFKSNLEQLITFFRDMNVRVTLCLPPPISTSKYLYSLETRGVSKEVLRPFFEDMEGMAEEYRKYKDNLWSLAEKYNCQVINLEKAFEGIENLDDYFSADGMHPNEAGYTLMSEELENHFNGALNKI